MARARRRAPRRSGHPTRSRHAVPTTAGRRACSADPGAAAAQDALGAQEAAGGQEALRHVQQLRRRAGALDLTRIAGRLARRSGCGRPGLGEPSMSGSSTSTRSMSFWARAGQPRATNTWAVSSSASTSSGVASVTSRRRTHARSMSPSSRNARAWLMRASRLASPCAAHRSTNLTMPRVSRVRSRCARVATIALESGAAGDEEGMPWVRITSPWDVRPALYHRDRCRPTRSLALPPLRASRAPHAASPGTRPCRTSTGARQRAERPKRPRPPGVAIVPYRASNSACSSGPTSNMSATMP